jgi:hypothetical protein
MLRNSETPGPAAPPGECTHLRQRHPRRPGMLPCASPTCPAGVADPTLALTAPHGDTDESLTPEIPLVVQRRLLILEEGERLFIWHPLAE